MTDEAGRRRLEAVEVLEVAPPPRRLVDDVTSRLAARLSVPCRVGPCPAIEIPHLVGRAQADADRLLERLEALERPGGTVAVGLTAEDIGHPIFTHFFGRARHDGRAVLVSVARLDPGFYGLPDDHGLTAHRAALEALHELGHVAGLPHCDDWDCLMRFAPSVDAIDNRGEAFCDTCLRSLPVAFAGLVA